MVSRTRATRELYSNDLVLSSSHRVDRVEEGREIRWRGLLRNDFLSSRSTGKHLNPSIEDT